MRAGAEARGYGGALPPVHEQGEGVMSVDVPLLLPVLISTCWSIRHFSFSTSIFAIAAASLCTARFCQRRDDKEKCALEVTCRCQIHRDGPVVDPLDDFSSFDAPLAPPFFLFLGTASAATLWRWAHRTGYNSVCSVEASVRMAVKRVPLPPVLISTCWSIRHFSCTTYFHLRHRRCITLHNTLLSKERRQRAHLRS